MCRKWESLEHWALNRMYLSPSVRKLSNLFERGVRSGINKSQRWNKTSRGWHLPDTIGVYIWIYTDHESVNSSQTNSQHGEEELGTNSQIFPRNHLHLIAARKRKINPFSSVERHCEYQPHSRIALMFKSNWPIQTRTHGLVWCCVCDFFVYFCMCVV